MFKELQGDMAIVVSGGVYKQVPLYTRNGYLFAAVSGGFVRLKSDGSTSKANLRMVHLEIEGELFVDRLGRLGDGSIKDAKHLETETSGLLMLE